MTFNKFYRLWNQYKINYDFQLSRKSYSELDELERHSGEFMGK